MWGQLVAAFARMIQSKVGQWVAAVFLFMGIQFATQSLVIAPALDELRDMLTSNNGGGGTLGVYALQWLGFLQFDQMITMVMSAYAARFTLRGAKAALVKR